MEGPALHRADHGRRATGVDDRVRRCVEFGEKVHDRAAPPDRAVFAGDPQPFDGEGAGGAGGAEVAKAEGGGYVGARRRELVGQVLQRRAADAAADEQRVGDALRGERAAQRPGQIDCLPHLEPGESLAARASRFDEQAGPVAVHGEQRERPAQQETTAGHRHHDELTRRRLLGDSGRHELERRERAEAAHRGDAAVGSLRPLIAVRVVVRGLGCHCASVALCRSCRQCTCTRGRRAASMAETAADAPASVVMLGTPLRSAVVRIS